MKFHINTPVVLLLQVSTALLLFLAQTPHYTEARLVGSVGRRGTAEAISSTTTDDSMLVVKKHDQQQGERLLEGSFFVSCLGSCSVNVDRGADCYDLTPDVKSQAGAMWFRVPFDVSHPFSVNATIYVGNKEGGGDGMAFVMQPNSSNELGTGGGGLGYNGIQNAFAVEVDTYKDGTFLNDHLELKYTSPSWTSLVRTELASDIESKNQELTFEIEWTAEDSPGQNNFFVRLGDEGVVMEAKLDSISQYLGGATTAFFGFTAGTGARHNLHYVCPVSISGELVPIVAVPVPVDEVPFPFAPLPDPGDELDMEEYP